MYVLTFYSFKGGVGRSMALMNVAASLAETGRRVLVADFDLEAPGLDTFGIPKPSGPTAGLIEYVTTYLKTSTSPHLLDYVYESVGIGKDGGRLWVMPAGRRDMSYAQQLNSIDWQELYARQDGFLMFEDLRLQWRELLKPDYVLIDSRTGHTDVGGICTRQLPDTVVVFFFPNDQNLIGLQQIVSEIRAERKPPQNKEIQLMFVASNVPNLDDEEEILADRLRIFRERLKYRELAATIQRYDSLTLLNQSIFTKERPRTSLARQYHQLAKTIIEQNPEDAEGAVTFIEHLSAGRLRGRPWRQQDLSKRLDSIQRLHSTDKQVLVALAKYRKLQGLHKDAIDLFDRVEQLGLKTAEVFVERAESKLVLEAADGAKNDLFEALQTTGGSSTHILRAIRLIGQIDDQLLPKAVILNGVSGLDAGQRYVLVKDLQRSYAGHEAVLKLFGIESGIGPISSNIKADIVLSLIGLGRYREAMQTISLIRDPESFDVVEAFNYAMAEWGDTGVPPADLFRRAAAFSKQFDTGNFKQCMAVSFWAIGNVAEARQSLDKSREIKKRVSGTEFSCWRYLQVEDDEFFTDLGEIEQLLEGSTLLPYFMRRQTATN